MRCWLITGLVSLLPIAGFCQQRGIEVENAWSRPAMQGRTGVVYFTVKDNGAPDRLLSVSSPVAERSELHESFDDHGVMKMRPVSSLPVAPGKDIRLMPGGNHVMLMNLKQPLKDGEQVPVTLTFENAGPVTVQATVERNPPHAGDGRPGTPGMPGMPGKAQ